MSDDVPEGFEDGSASPPVQKEEIRQRPKGGTYAKLNQGAVKFLKVQEEHAFVVLCISIIFVVAVGAWSFYQYYLQGGGFITYVTGTFILFIFAFCFFMDWLAVKEQTDRVLFWKAWIAACLFPVILITGRISHNHQAGKYERKLEGLTNQITDTRNYFTQVISNTNDYYSTLRIENNGLSNQLDVERQKSSDILSLEYRPNYYAYLAKSFLSNGQYSLSAIYFERVYEAEVQLHVPHGASQYRVLAPLYLTAQYMTNAESELVDSNYLDSMLSLISQNFVANDGVDMLGKMDGNFALVIGQIIPPSRTNVIHTLQDDLDRARVFVKDKNQHAP